MNTATKGALGASVSRTARVVLAAIATLALAVSVAVAPARAATVEETLADGVFVNEPGSTGRCTVYAAANMLRRAALLNGDPDWGSIQVSSVPTRGGLPWSFSVSTPTASYDVDHGTLGGSVEEKTARLRQLLAENPAGIVLYASTGRPHAVTLLSYDEGSGRFVAHDSLTHETSDLEDCVSVRVSNADAYWYVSSKVSRPDLRSLAEARIEVDDLVLGGPRPVPRVTVRLGETTLVEGRDYGVSCSDTRKVGPATVTVTGLGDYVGAATARFEVVDGAKMLSDRCSGPGELVGTSEAPATSGLASLALGV